MVIIFMEKREVGTGYMAPRGREVIRVDMKKGCVVRISRIAKHCVEINFCEDHCSVL